MKSLKILSLIILTALMTLSFTGIKSSEEPRIFKPIDIEKIQNDQTRDSLHKIEYLASKYFHEKLNNYRKSMNLDTLNFSYIHWIASHNHSYWMSHNNYASHTQKKSTKYFTGETPTERLEYLGTKCTWTGENVLSDPSAYKKKMTPEEAAQNISDRALNLWITSTNHHRIMLLSKHSVVGTAFVIDSSGKVWATSLFGQCESTKNSKNLIIFTSSFLLFLAQVYFFNR